jgi:hypothetical protein
MWLARHGHCVDSLHITYNPDADVLFQQLPLSKAPLVGLVRLEVDGPDSLVALAPALPQLVALTHLSASISLVGSSLDPPYVFSAERPLQQLCPGLKSLRLAIDCSYSAGLDWVDAPVVNLMPAGLQQLHITCGSTVRAISLDSGILTSLTALRSLSLVGLAVDPDPLFHMPSLEQVDLCGVQCLVDGEWSSLADWLVEGVCTALQHLTKLSGMTLSHAGVGPWSLQSLVTTVPGVCKLEVDVERPSDTTAAWVQQLSGFACLRHLDLSMYSVHMEGDATAVVSELSSLQQLTYLRLSDRHARVQPSTWAGVLPCLPQLQVLGVSKQLLLEGLAAEVA